MDHKPRPGTIYILYFHPNGLWYPLFLSFSIGDSITASETKWMESTFYPPLRNRQELIKRITSNLGVVLNYNSGFAETVDEKQARFDQIVAKTRSSHGATMVLLKRLMDKARNLGDISEEQYQQLINEFTEKGL